VSCRAGINGPTTRPDRAELNGSCRALPMGCRPGPNTARFVLRAGLGPFPVVPGHPRVGPNHSGHGPAHLPRAKISGLVAWHPAARPPPPTLLPLCHTSMLPLKGVDRRPVSPFAPLLLTRAQARRHLPCPSQNWPVGLKCQGPHFPP
jgi:hypothetical protein